MSFRDAFLKLCQISEQFTIIKHLSGQQSLKALFKNYSTLVSEVLDTCFAETASSRKIKLLEWPKGVKFICRMSNTPYITKRQIEEDIKKSK